jgi:hypothetical protein
MGDLILADFKSKTYHKPELPSRAGMEELIAASAVEIMNQIGETIREKIPYGGAGIDGMPYKAPPEDCA